jgi:ABC-type sugar transport system ATPase subunit
VVGPLGPDGAGKTTFVRVLDTLLRPTAGRASVPGHDVVAEPLAVRRRNGLAGQFAAVDEELTGRENVETVGRVYRLSGGRQADPRTPAARRASATRTPAAASSKSTMGRIVAVREYVDSRHVGHVLLPSSTANATRRRSIIPQNADLRRSLMQITDERFDGAAGTGARPVRCDC